MKTLTAKEALYRVVESIPDHTVRVIEEMQVGQVIHQGDVYLHRVADDWPRGKLLGTRQIAVGTTVGSRHIVVGDGYEVYEGKQLPDYVTFSKLDSRTREAVRKELCGPVVVLRRDGGALTHPEHADHQHPCGVYQVQYQLDGKTMVRVTD